MDPDGWFYEMLVKRLKKNTFRMPKGGNYYKGFCSCRGRSKEV